MAGPGPVGSGRLPPPPPLELAASSSGAIHPAAGPASSVAFDPDPFYVALDTVHVRCGRPLRFPRYPQGVTPIIPPFPPRSRQKCRPPCLLLRSRRRSFAAASSTSCQRGGRPPRSRRPPSRLGPEARVSSGGLVPHPSRSLSKQRINPHPPLARSPAVRPPVDQEP